MAGTALIEGNVGKMLKTGPFALFNFMTGCTINVLMFAFQRELCLMMVKKRRRAERIGVVTGSTIAGKSLFMDIFMAGNTAVIKPQVGIILFANGFLPDVLRFMTGRTFRFLVASGQRIASQAVIKLLFVKPDNFKF